MSQYADLPQIHSRADAEKHVGQRVVVHGEYAISRTRALEQPVYIVLPDGHAIRRSSDRIEDEHFQDRKVVVVGVLGVDEKALSAQPKLAFVEVEKVVASPK